MQIMDQFGAAPGAESVRMPDGTERTLAAEHAAAILVNEQPAFRVVCTPELLPQLALGRLLTEGWIASAEEVEQIAVCAEGLKVNIYLNHPLTARRAAAQEVSSCCTDNVALGSPVEVQPLRAVRAEAEAQVARYDYAAAVDRFKAGQDLARRGGAANDHIEASIIDTRLRAVQSLLKEQTAER